MGDVDNEEQSTGKETGQTGIHLDDDRITRGGTPESDTKLERQSETPNKPRATQEPDKSTKLVAADATTPALDRDTVAERSADRAIHKRKFDGHIPGDAPELVEGPSATAKILVSIVSSGDV